MLSLHLKERLYLLMLWNWLWLSTFPLLLPVALCYNIHRFSLIQPFPLCICPLQWSAQGEYIKEEYGQYLLASLSCNDRRKNYRQIHRRLGVEERGTDRLIVVLYCLANQPWAATPSQYHLCSTQSVLFGSAISMNIHRVNKDQVVKIWWCYVRTKYPARFLAFSSKICWISILIIKIILSQYDL